MTGKAKHRLLAGAIVPTRLWRSKTFTALPAVTQHLYLALRTQRNVSPAGCWPLDIPALAALTPDGTSARTRSALAILHQKELITWDSTTNEVYVRGWLADVPDTFESVAAVQRCTLAIREIASATIRGFLLMEGTQVWRKMDAQTPVHRELGDTLSWLTANLGVDHETQQGLFSDLPGDHTPASTDSPTPSPAIDVSRSTQPVDGTAMVQAWTDGYRRTHSKPPPQQRVARFGSAARQALKQGGYTDPEFLAAASHAGRQDWIDITVTLSEQHRRTETTVTFNNSDTADTTSTDGAAAYAALLNQEGPT